VIKLAIFVVNTPFPPDSYRDFPLRFRVASAKQSTGEGAETKLSPPCLATPKRLREGAGGNGKGGNIKITNCNICYNLAAEAYANLHQRIIKKSKYEKRYS